MTNLIKEPFKIVGVEFAPLKIPMQRRLQTFAVFTYMSLFLSMSLTTTATMIVLMYTPFFFISILYVSWMVYDRNTAETGGKPPEKCSTRSWRLWRHFANYFPIKLIKTADLDPNKSYLLGCHPHGILCFGAFCCFGTNALNVDQVFPGLFPRLLTLIQQFQLPGSRELLSRTGACAATKKGMEALLSIPKGTMSVLIVGGASEALNYDESEIKLVLNKRKGFIKLALRFGRDLVPVFSFGENFIYGQAPNPEGSRLRRFQNWFERVFKFSPPIFYGRGIFQYNWGIVPYRKPINVVVGAPIPVERIENPTNEDIAQLHAKYVEAVKKLYEDHNPTYGDPNVKLVVS